LFRGDEAGGLRPAMHGQIDGVGSRPQFRDRNPAGVSLVERDVGVAEIAKLLDAL
jgi:hypothetical protein